ncbi:MAG: C-GCAxxG-C-C family protein [Bacteroidales bacterium]|nr:C-GCAxxG-C-C family protein [Bacteroidales bacterium]
MTDTESRADLAADLFMQGYNCGQAVVVAFADRFGLSREEAARIAGAFGGGIGRQRLTCGTVLGMTVLAGLEEGNADPADKAGQKRCFDTVKQMTAGFVEQYGSTVCAELLGMPGHVKADGPAQHQAVPEKFCAKPCALKVQLAVRLFEKYLREKASRPETPPVPGVQA